MFDTDNNKNIMVQFPVFTQPYTQQPLILYQIETVPVPITSQGTGFAETEGERTLLSLILCVLVYSDLTRSEYTRTLLHTFTGKQTIYYTEFRNIYYN